MILVSVASSRGCPLAKFLEDALRHFGCRGLCVGQAEDPLGRCPGQQQTQHAQLEYMRLAGPRRWR